MNLTVEKAGLKGMWPWLLALVIVWCIHPYIGDVMNDYWFGILIYSGINIILAVSLNLVNGFTGQFSIGHAGFMAIGAYSSAYFSTQLTDTYPGLFENDTYQAIVFLGLILFGGLVATVAGYIVGLPSLRLKGDYLAIVTLGFGEIIRVLILNTDAVGGARGLPGIPKWTTFGWDFTFVIIAIFVCWRIVHSAQGRILLSIREDEIAGEAMGVNTTQGKVRAFMIGAFFAGVSGALFAHYLQYLNPSPFDFNRSFEVIIMVVLGGMGSITGSVVAAVFLTFLKEALRPLQDFTQIDFRMVIYSLVLIIMMLTRPEGIFGTREVRDFFSRKRRSGAPAL